MSTYLDALLAGQDKARSLATNEDAVDVDVSESAPPNPGDVLTAVDSSRATWQPPSGGDGTAVELGSTGAPINVDGAEPPVAGQVLTATDPEHAVWRVPGLHYDPSIKFWTSSVGSATILPNSWGFIQQGEGATDPVVVYIVSSLEAPPVDSRFGLYVWREMTVPVTVNVLGDSQIQGLDGVLGTSAVLLPGADYEWVFYHEDGFAIWGLVSDTAGVAKHVSLGDAGIVPITQTGDVEVGSVLTFMGDHAEWLPPSGGGGLVLGPGTSPASGEWVIAAMNTDVELPVADGEGERVGVYLSPGTDGVNVVSDANIVLNRTTGISHQLRPGGWYEWTSVSFGEDIRWVPHGGQGEEAKAALEYGGAPTSTPVLPNQWVLAANGDVVNTPSNPLIGDCLGVYVNGASAAVVPATGQSIVSPDGTTIIGSPSALTLPGNTYYEWIWVASVSHWKPKNYLDAPGNGLIRSGKTLAVGANADASIVVNADDIRVGVLATDAQHGVRGGGTQHALATASADGFMPATAFAKVADVSAAFKAPARYVATSDVGSAITTGGNVTIDGFLAVTSDRVLLTGQVDAKQNGIWIVNSGAAWARASDADTSAKFPAGTFIPVIEGSSFADTVWTLTTNNPITLGTTNLTIQLLVGLRGTGTTPQTIQASSGGSVGSLYRWAPIDHVHGIYALDPGMNGFRISNNAASLATDGSSSSVFLAPHSGYRISLYDGTNWQNVTLASPPSTGLVGQTAGIPCDVFVVYGSLTTATLELTAWTNATTRAAAIAQQNGVWVKTGFKRYVGTILPDSATTYSHVSSASGASSPVCGIWNQDNRICGQFTWLPTFLSWTTPTANTWLQLNAQAAAKVQYVQGQSVDIVSAEHIGAASGTAGAALGIGIDSTTTPSGLRDQTANTGIGPLRAQIKQLIAAGAHSLSALARGGATSVIFYGGDVPMQGGLTAELWY